MMSARGRLVAWGVCAVLAVLSAAAGAAEIFVDNVKGDDGGDGSAGKPFRTIVRALKAAKTSDTVFLTANPEPYCEFVDMPVGGTAEKPFVLDGRGAVVNTLTRYGADRWTDEGSGVFSMPLPNNAHVMDVHWSGFDLVFFDGKPGTNAVSRETLAENGYFLFKRRLQIEGKWHPLHNRLFIRLPAGRTPADVRVEAPGVGTILHVGRPYVTVRNLTAMYSTCDGFSTTRAPGIVFERVRGCYNMDQGISHHGAEVVVRDSRFDHNAGCGIVDVYPEVKVRYERCLVEDDTYRGGVEFHSGEFTMEDCVIRNNRGNALSVSRPGTRVILKNCLLMGRSDTPGTGVYQGEGSLAMERCTLSGFKTGLVVGGNAERLTVSGCAFVGCGQNYAIQAAAPPDRQQSLSLDGNAFDPAPFTVRGKVYAPEAWEALRTATGMEARSRMGKMTGPSLPWSVPRGEKDPAVGAALDPSRAYGPPAR